MKLCHRFGKRQSQSGARMLGIIGRAGSVERLHDQWDILRLHADPSVADPEPQPRLADLTRNGDLAARRRKLDRVADQVDEYLFELERIGLEDRPGRRVSFDAD